MDSGRIRMAPYVRATAKLRYSPTNLPPLEPPAELRLPNPGLWRVASRWLHDHQPDEGGRVCRHCFRWYPCPGAVSADGVLDSILRRATVRGRAAVLELNRGNRNV